MKPDLLPLPGALDEAEPQAVRALAALAQAQRLRAFRALVQAGPDGLTPGALAESLGMAASTLSFHLKALLQAELVSSQTQGRHLIYRARYERMAALMDYLTLHCCQGEPCALPGASEPGCAC